MILSKKHDGEWWRRLPLFLILVSVYGFIISPCAHSKEVIDQANKPGLLPSEALLEFLVEFENIDDETFNLLIQRGQKDVETSKQDDKEASAKALDGGIGNE